MIQQDSHLPQVPHRKEDVSPLAVVGEEEEIALNQLALSPHRKDLAREGDADGEGGGQRMANLATNVLMIALCLLFLYFCYIKINLGVPGTGGDVPSLPPEATNNRLQTKQFSAEPFTIKRTIWYYADNAEQFRELRLLYEANNRRFAKISNYTFVSLNKLTCHEYLPDSIIQSLQSLEKALRFRSQSKRILRMITLMHILHRHGGVAISENILMTESLGWLESIRASPYLNGDFHGQRVEVVAFFSPQMTPDPEMVQWGWFKKQAATALALQNYFLAADKDTHFMDELLKRLVSGLTNQQTITSIQRKLTLHPSQNLFDSLFQNTCLQMFKQKGLSSVLSYGVAAINEALSATKLERQMEKTVFQQRMALLSHLSLEQLEDTFGNFRYFTVMHHEAELLLFLPTVTKRQHTLMADSFLRLFLLPKKQAAYVYSNPEEDRVQLGQQWKGLPKIVWVYSADGIQKSQVLEYLMTQRIKLAAGSAGFEMRQVNDSNIDQYIGYDVLGKIESVVRKHPNRNKDAKSQLIRLAIIAEHGGVYIDSSIVLLQDLSWLKNIASAHSNRLIQRCGSIPKSFLLWDVLQTRPLAWSISRCNSKAPHSPFYLTSLIAGEPQSSLFSEWLNRYLELLPKPQQEAQWSVQNCGDQYQRTPQSLSAAALGCVMKERQRQMLGTPGGVSSSASHFYELWSMNGLALSKASPPFLVERDAISEITQMSMEYLQQLSGPLRQFVKLNDLQMQQLNDFIIQHHENIHQYVHSSSLVAKYILPPPAYQLAYVGGVLRVQQS